MAVSPISTRPRRTRHDSCNDQVIGAILSGWRYDISGISPAMRGDYEDHLAGCSHCRHKQRVHRTLDVLLLCAFTLTTAAFVLVALVFHRLKVFAHFGEYHLRLHQASVTNHIPASIAISLEAVAIAGVVVSMLLLVLVAIATPVPSIVTTYVREHVSPEMRERLQKRAA